MGTSMTGSKGRAGQVIVWLVLPFPQNPTSQRNASRSIIQLFFCKQLQTLLLFQKVMDRCVLVKGKKYKIWVLLVDLSKFFDKYFSL